MILTTHREQVDAPVSQLLRHHRRVREAPPARIAEVGRVLPEHALAEGSAYGSAQDQSKDQPREQPGRRAALW